ncbi:MAG TPA: M15 family metallopeptidase [Candidatus Saccharimonadales bacterium]|nr:M15 family metallopeptidase [Candidatus Saccharimonadales bacterium]
MKKRVLFGIIAVLVIVLGGIAYFALTTYNDGRTNKSSTPKSTPKTSATKPTPEPTFNKRQYSLTDPSSPWVIVNKQHPLSPISYAPTDLAAIGNGQQMRAEAATALQKMFTDASAAGFTLVADSGYRSYDTQVSTYGSVVKAYGQAYADTVSARPGFSEHQTGWAVDIGSNGCHVADCFGATADGKWTQANAYKYGFLLRYPDSLTSITGYSHEAWHFRYIGIPLATELHAQNVLTLEQFFTVTGGTAYISAP